MSLFVGGDKPWFSASDCDEFTLGRGTEINSTSHSLTKW